MDCDCSDPRDRVFAVLSLMEPVARSFIPVDYSLSYHAVYAHALIATMKTSGLDLLRYATTNGEVNDIAFGHFLSDWRIKCKLRQQLNEPTPCCWRAKVDTRVVLSLKTVQEEQCGMTTSMITFESPTNSKGPGTLLTRFRTRAHYVDVVQCQFRQVKAEIGEKNFDSKELVPFFELAKGTTNHPSLKVELQSIMAERIKDRKYTHSEGVLASQLPIYYVKAIEHVANFADLLTFEQAVRKEYANITEILGKRQQSSRGNELLTLFHTHYSVGFCRVHFRAGDVVFAVDGLSTPLILRKVGQQQYEIIGGCYLWAALELDY